jgi:hypothetical protein
MSKQSFVILSTTEGQIYLTHTATPTTLTELMIKNIGFYSTV